MLRALWVFAGIAAVLSIYLALQEPLNSGPWQPGQTRTPVAEISGRTLSITDVRDFTYARDSTEVVDRRYVDKTYNLDQLDRVWFGLSHFGPYGMAHSFLSFEFTSGDNLVLSLEARLRPDQSYSPTLGLMRQYTKIYVMATERDVIGLRTQHRGERVLLYPIVNYGNTSPEAFLRTFLTDLNALATTPAFYNTLLDNCLTNLLKNTASSDEIGFADLRVLLPGRSDRLTYIFGATPDSMPFETARAMATIKPESTSTNDSEFSTKIRCGWAPLFPELAEVCAAISPLANEATP
ncbi:MAG: DUF4105 domain-containing protein [Halioglobus sp.]